MAGTGNDRVKFIDPPINEIANIVFESSESARIFEAIRKISVSTNRPRDLQIAERITDLYRIVLAEGEPLQPASLEQCVRFFLDHPNPELPIITVTPDGTLRSRWITGPDNFIAIEFMGASLVKLVAELRRADGQIATYFVSETVSRIASVVTSIGGSLG